MIQITHDIEIDPKETLHSPGGIIKVVRCAVQLAAKEAMDLFRPGIVDKLNALFQTPHFKFAQLDVTEDEWDGVRIRYTLECPDGLALSGGMELVVNAANLAIVDCMASVQSAVQAQAEAHASAALDLWVTLPNLKTEDNNKTPDEPAQAMQIKAYKEGLLVVDIEEFKEAKKKAAGIGTIKAYEAGSLYQSMTQIPPPDGLLPDLSKRNG